MIFSEINGLILCAGKGTRMSPLSDIIPKPLLPINGKAILYWNIIALHKIGLEKIGIIVNEKTKAYFSRFIKNELPEEKIKFFIQEEQLGIVDAIKSATNYKYQNLIALAGDTMFSSDNIKNIINPLMLNKADIVIGIIKRSAIEIARRSNIQLDKFDPTIVIRTIEKPNESEIIGNWSGAPIWSFKSTIWDLLIKSPKSERGEFDFSNVNNLAINSGMRVRAQIVESCPDLTFPKDVLINNFPYIKRLICD